MHEPGSAARLLDRVGDDRLHGSFRMCEPVHERGVRAVLEQAADEIGQQMLVAAHGRVDSAAVIERYGCHERRVKLLAHAVQALKLEFPARSDLENPGDRVGVVGCELRVQMRVLEQQGFRTGEVGHVRVGLEREDGIAVESLLLSPFDLRVPVRTLDEAHGDAAARCRAAREPLEPCEHVRGALLIGLHGKAEACVVAKGRGAVDALEDDERRHQAIRFLCIDGQHDPGVSRPHGESQQSVRELGYGPRAL